MNKRALVIDDTLDKQSHVAGGGGLLASILYREIIRMCSPRCIRKTQGQTQMQSNKAARTSPWDRCMAALTKVYLRSSVLQRTIHMHASATGPGPF